MWSLGFLLVNFYIKLIFVINNLLINIVFWGGNMYVFGKRLRKLRKEKGAENQKELVGESEWDRVR